MTELEYCRMMLNNHIDGLKIIKSALPEVWADDDERTLDLMVRIKAILDRVEVTERRTDG